MAFAEVELQNNKLRDIEELVNRPEVTLPMGRIALYDDIEFSWQDEANCLGVDPRLFFPKRGENTRQAKEVCHSCVVREDCLEFAIGNMEKHGIWGGLSELERRQERGKRERAAKRLSA